MIKLVRYTEDKERTHILHRLEHLKGSIKYKGCRYVDTYDLAFAAGVNRDIFVWVYCGTDLSIEDAVAFAQEIETGEKKPRKNSYVDRMMNLCHVSVE